eukprot:17166-Heterococcus_DN1.PRE.3
MLSCASVAMLLKLNTAHTHRTRYSSHTANNAQDYTYAAALGVSYSTTTAAGAAGAGAAVHNEHSAVVLYAEQHNSIVHCNATAAATSLETLPRTAASTDANAGVLQLEHTRTTH